LDNKCALDGSVNENPNVQKGGGRQSEAQGLLAGSPLAKGWGGGLGVPGGHCLYAIQQPRPKYSASDFR
jgi:hypothetical protein